MKEVLNKHKKVIIPLVILTMFLIIGTSYALWQITLRQTNPNTVTTACFKVQFTDKNPITLNESFPLKDEEGRSLTPYEFTVTNICDTAIRYQVNLEVLNQTTLIEHSYIKAMYNEKTPSQLTEYEKVDKTLNNATDSYNLGFGYLEANQEVTLTLRLWLSDDTPLSSDTMEKTFSSKVTVTTSYAKKLPGTLRQITDQETKGMWEYKNNITKLIIQNKLSNINNAIKVSDESASQDESIMSYVVANEDGSTYTAYLQGQDVIYLNPDSSYLFYGFEKVEQIEGIKYLDTSSVIRMNHMFWNCYNLTNIDLSSFDTSSVTTMNHMFNSCSNLTTIDLSSFDTSKVTAMYGMFNSCSSLTTLDLSNFNTSNVTTMNSMFYNCNNLTTIDLSNFDTSEVTDMVSMFRYCNSLTSLDISNFDTSQVINMSYMFYDCNNLTSLDLSGFDTSKVTSMSSMFRGCISLTDLNLSSFDTSKVRDMNNMFASCHSLTSLDLSTFNTSIVLNMEYMLLSCKNLNNITYGVNFIHSSSAKVTNMFSSCPANKPTHSSWNGVTF